jgi:RHS repeat-associated protein
LGSLAAAITGPQAAAATPVKNASANIGTMLGNTPAFTNIAGANASQTGGTQPKAYLNILFFDERFNFVEGTSQSTRVVAAGDNAAPIALLNIKVPKNGYAFVYVSNESPTNVFFDDLQVRQDNGRILEENHYYAYGLKIAALSSKAFGGAQNNYQYQGDYSEFDDDLGWQDFMLRSYDPQIGRFLQNDPYDQFSSGYVGMGNDPGNGVDPTGGWQGDGKSKKRRPVDAPGRLYHSPDAAAWGWSRCYKEQLMTHDAIEYSSGIYEIIIGDEKFYSFTEITSGPSSAKSTTLESHTPGPLHFMKSQRTESREWDRSYLVPDRAKLVGHIHSHPPKMQKNEQNRFLSPADRDNQEKALSKSDDGEFYSYLFNYFGELRKWFEGVQDDRVGTLIVDGMYNGTNADNRKNGGMGSYDVTIINGNQKSNVRNIDFRNKSLFPLDNKNVWITNASSGAYQIVNDRQRLTNSLRTFMTAFPLVAQGINNIMNSISIPGGIPCPKF